MIARCIWRVSLSTGGAVQRLLEGRRVVTSYDAAPNGRMVASTAPPCVSPRFTRMEDGTCAR